MRFAPAPSLATGRPNTRRIFFALKRGICPKKMVRGQSSARPLTLRLAPLLLRFTRWPEISETRRENGNDNGRLTRSCCAASRPQQAWPRGR